MAEYLGQAVLNVAVAPGRVAYLIRHDSREGFRRAVQEACTRWGGQTEPIVPTQAGGVVDGWWRQVVGLAGVEAVINVNVPDDDAVAVAGQLGLPLRPLAQIDDPWSHLHSPSIRLVLTDSQKPLATRIYCRQTIRHCGRRPLPVALLTNNSQA